MNERARAHFLWTARPLKKLRKRGHTSSYETEKLKNERTCEGTLKDRTLFLFGPTSPVLTENEFQS